MTFEEYADKYLSALTTEARQLVRMGWNGRGKFGSEIERNITPKMIEAGAQRLVAWEDNSEWPDSWSPMTVAAARNDAERVIRSALNAAGADHIADASKKVPVGDVSVMGRVVLMEGKEFDQALVVSFESGEECRRALTSGQCRFTVFGGEV